MTDFAVLAQAARPVNDDDWGSERQIAAFNEFCHKFNLLVSRKVYEQWAAYCHKATTDEMIDEAIRLLGGK